MQRLCGSAGHYLGTALWETPAEGGHRALALEDGGDRSHEAEGRTGGRADEVMSGGASDSRISSETLADRASWPVSVSLCPPVWLFARPPSRPAPIATRVRTISPARLSTPRALS